MSNVDISLEIQALLRQAGFYTGKVDGSIGPKSRAALNDWLASLESPAAPPPRTLPSAEPITDHQSPITKSPWPLEAEAAKFYGKSDGSEHWENANLVLLDLPYSMRLDDGTLLRRIRCHRLVADDLGAILQEIWEEYERSSVAIAANGLDRFDGCYNFRPIRGASNLSMHAYGAAIDFDAAHNPLGAIKGRMPAAVVAIFKRHGWRWGGDYSGRKDWMHFEACR